MLYAFQIIQQMYKISCFLSCRFICIGDKKLIENYQKIPC